MAKSNTQTKTRTKVAVDIPARYKVVIHNDDVTPMHFVIQLLIEVFNKNISEAEELMLKVHNDGTAVAGVYSYEIAEQKVAESVIIASHAGHPLELSIDKL